MPDQNRVRCPVCDHLVWTSNLRKRPRFGVFEQKGVPGGHGITLEELDDKDGIDKLAGVKLLDALVMFLREGWLTKEEVLRSLKLTEKEREKWGLSKGKAESERERKRKIKWGISPERRAKELLKWAIRRSGKESEEEKRERQKWGIKEKRRGHEGGGKMGRLNMREKTEKWRDKNPMECEDLDERTQEIIGCKLSDEEIAERPPMTATYHDEVEGKIYLMDARKVHHIQDSPPEIRRNVKPVEPAEEVQKRKEMEV